MIHYPALFRRFLPVLALFGFSAVAQAQTNPSILPDAVAGQGYSFQITTSPAQPAGTSYAADGLPAGLAINGASGLISGTTGAVGTYRGNVTLTNSTVSQFPYQITVDPAAGSPTITSSGGAVGTVGTSFSYTITTSPASTSFNIAQLPPGLAASGGVISGVPTAAGLFFTSISGNNSAGQGAILVLMFTISPPGPVPAITSSLVVTSAVGAAFTYTITATNSPTSFTAAGLPAGLALNTSTGVISGTPTAPAVSVIPLTASNANGASPVLKLNLTVGAFSSITSGASLSATVGTPFSTSLTATNAPQTFSLSGLPAGLAVNTNTGAVTGTPTTAGIYTLYASATNSLGAGPVAPLTLTVTNSNSTGGNLTAPAILTAPISQGATVGSNVVFSVTAVGAGPLSYQWSLNGTPISGATAATLALGGVKVTDAGAYTVTVTNAQGAVTSPQANLSVLSLILPPVITSPPSKITGTVGTATSFAVAASGSAPLSYQWFVNGNAIAGATAATFTLPNTRATDAGTYSVIVANPYGTATSAGAVLTVSTTPIAPIFQYQPASTAVSVGGTASFSVGVVGSSPITYQWYKGAAAIPGATQASLSFPSAQLSDNGNYTVTITNPGGTVTSTSAAVLTVSPSGGVPVPIAIVLQPVGVSTTVGGSASFTVAVTGDPSITYQWRKNQAAIAGGTGPSFTIANAQLSDAGTYDVIVANGFSATISFPTPLTVTPGSSTSSGPSRLINISLRGSSGPADQALALGFVIGGSGTKTALVRAVGPTLANFGVTGLMADPKLTIVAGTQVVGTNDNWGGTAALTATFAQTGAFPLPAASADSALATNFAPGAYSALVAGAGGGTGVVLLELYDADTGASPSARFVNFSGRGVAGSGANVLTVGFVIGGGSTKTVLIRAIGPTLGNFGVSGTLADPQLSVYGVNAVLIGSNDDWGGTAALTAAFTSVGAFALAPASKDSALLLTLAPGAYTAQVNGSGGASGVALLEVYELP